MTSPISCGTCTFWRKDDHPHANWGSCTKVTYDDNLVYAIGELRTRDAFYCALYELKPQQTYTIVDAAREAARTFNSKRKE